MHWQVHIEEPADVFFNRGVAPPTGFFGIAEMKQLVLERTLKFRTYFYNIFLIRQDPSKIYDFDQIVIAS